jgi:hypothetical protein
VVEELTKCLDDSVRLNVEGQIIHAVVVEELTKCLDDSVRLNVEG